METVPTIKEASPKKPKLTKKQRGFVRDYLATGSGQEAALKNYNLGKLGGKDAGNSARAIASENLTKPNVIEAIEKALSNDFLADKHKELFEQKKVDYFVFPKSMPDEEIIGHVKSSGIEVITVRTTEKGKLAFYSLPDSQAIKGGLEMAYKIKGVFNEGNVVKSQSLNTYNFIFSPETQADVKAIEDKLKSRLMQNHVQKD